MVRFQMFSFQKRQVNCHSGISKQNLFGATARHTRHALRNQMEFRAFIRSRSLSLSERKLYKFIHMVKILAAS